MRTLLAALALALWFCTAAPAQEAVSPADRAAIQGVITAQIEAFRQGDGAAALAFAAPNIRAKFGDGPQFLAMVRRAYMPVVRPQSVSFGALKPGDDGKLVQGVELVGSNGDAALALYAMEHEADGSWRIAGCTLARSERLAI